MRVHYYPDTDSLYIEVRPDAGTETLELADGLLLDLDASGWVVGLDIDSAVLQLLGESRSRLF